MVIVVVGGAGCKNDGVAGSELSKQVDAAILQAGVYPKNVRCPSAQAKVGVEIRCSLEVDGQRHEINAVITEVEAGKASFTIKWPGGTPVISNKLEAGLTSDLTEDLASPVKVECGSQQVLFTDAQRTITCKAAVASLEAKVIVTYSESMSVEKWVLHPPLFSKSRVEHAILGSVREKIPTAMLSCGTDAVFPRPTDGVVWCELTGPKDGRIKITIDDKDVAKLRWELVDS